MLTWDLNTPLLEARAQVVEICVSLLVEKDPPRGQI